MASNLKHIAKALGVPSSSSSDEIRTLVDGNLAELSNEPRNMQVWLHGSSMIELVNTDGVFLQIEELEADFPPLLENLDTNSLEDDEMQLLKQALLDAESSQDALQEEVTKLTAEAEKLSQCCKELWNLNCTQLTEFDAILAAKDEEIAMLHQQSRTSTPVVVRPFSLHQE